LKSTATARKTRGVPGRAAGRGGADVGVPEVGRARGRHGAGLRPGEMRGDRGR